MFSKKLVLSLLAATTMSAWGVATSDSDLMTNSNTLKPSAQLQRIIDRMNNSGIEGDIYSDEDLLSVYNQARLGDGFSTERDSVVNRICFNNGTPDVENRTDHYLNIDKRWTLLELKQHLGIDVGVKARYKMFSASTRNKFTYDSVQSFVGESFTYYSRVNTEDKIVNPDHINGSYFTDYAQGIIDRNGNGSVAFKNACGDQVVSKIEYGAELFLQVQLNFFNRRDKAEFESRNRFSVIPLGSITSALKSSMQFLVDTGEIRIIGLQVGGNANRLSQILRSTNPNNPIPIATCRFNNLKSCEDMIAALVDYASEEFSKQLDNPNDPNYRPTVFKYHTQSYSGWNGGEHDPSARPVVGINILKARRELAKDYEKAMEDKARIDELSVVLLSNTHKEKLKQIKPLLLENISFLKYAGETCFEQIDECIETKNYVYELINDKDRYIDRKYLDIRDEQWRITFWDRSGHQQTIHLQYNSTEDDVDLFTKQRYIGSRIEELATAKVWYIGKHFFMETNSDRFKFLYAGEFASGNSGSIRMKLIPVHETNAYKTAGTVTRKEEAGDLYEIN